MNDQQLSIEALYNQELKRVYGFFYAKTLDQSLAEDLTSKTFMAYVEKAATTDINNGQKFLFGIMHKQWLQYLQLKYRSRELATDTIDDIAHDADDTIEQLDQQSLRDYATVYIEQLPKAQRVVLQLRLLEQKSLTEICSELDKSMNYVRTTQRRGLNSLRYALATSPRHQLIMEQETSS